MSDQTGDNDSMMKFLILLFISANAFALPRLEWKGEVSGIKKTDQKNIWKVETKSDEIEVVLDCASPTNHLAVIEENVINNSIALEGTECRKIQKRLESWSKKESKYTLRVDSLRDAVVSKE